MQDHLGHLFSLVFGSLVLKMYKLLKVTYIKSMEYVVCTSQLKMILFLLYV